MSNIVLVKNQIADAVINAFSIVKFGTTDGHIVPAAAVSDSLVGVSTDIAAAIGDRADVIVHGLADVLYGVTMQEHGVSKIVSVKFHKADEPVASGRDLEPKAGE